nr:MAG TPA: hypothetical protein [Caudoviricetes sp.]
MVYHLQHNFRARRQTQSQTDARVCLALSLY